MTSALDKDPHTGLLILPPNFKTGVHDKLYQRYIKWRQAYNLYVNRETSPRYQYVMNDKRAQIMEETMALHKQLDQKWNSTFSKIVSLAESDGVECISLAWAESHEDILPEECDWFRKQRFFGNKFRNENFPQHT